MKDWTGNKKSTFVTLGASNHSEKERESNDYYATEPKAMELLLEKELFQSNIWECAVGGGSLADVLIKNGYNVRCSDLIDRNYPNTEIIDFLKCNELFNGDIITNPPYKYAQDFVEKALELIPVGNKVAMFLKIQFLEGQKRRKMFDENPPKTIYVASKRLNCAMNGDFEKYGSSAMCYAWFMWEKGFKGEPTIEWIN